MINTETDDDWHYANQSKEEKSRKILVEDFIELFGENPEDVLGPDWENYIEDYISSNEEIKS